MAQAASPLTQKRTLAWLVCALLVLSFLLSAAFVLFELHHDCSGEHCEICLAVAHSVAYLKAGAAAMLPVMLIAHYLFAVLWIGFDERKLFTQKDSPVTLKVKLSD